MVKCSSETILSLQYFVCFSFLDTALFPPLNVDIDQGFHWWEKLSCKKNKRQEKKFIILCFPKIWQILMHLAGMSFHQAYISFFLKSRTYFPSKIKCQGTTYTPFQFAKNVTHNKWGFFWNSFSFLLVNWLLLCNNYLFVQFRRDPVL